MYMSSYICIYVYIYICIITSISSVPLPLSWTESFNVFSTSWGCASIQGLEGGAQAWVVWFLPMDHPKTTACDVWFVEAFVAGTTVLPLRFLYGALLLHLVVSPSFWEVLAKDCTTNILGLLPLNSWRCWKTRPRPLLLTTLCPERWALYWAFDNSGEVWRSPIDIRNMLSTLKARMLRGLLPVLHSFTFLDGLDFVVLFLPSRKWKSNHAYLCWVDFLQGAPEHMAGARRAHSASRAAESSSEDAGAKLRSKWASQLKIKMLDISRHDILNSWLNGYFFR